MARARNIKPGTFKNELLGEADPMLTLLFISLWTLADKRGRLEDRPLRIKAETFPYRENININGYLTELERLGFICRYVVNGCAYLQVLNFEKHQTPHKTEKESVIPPPPSIDQEIPIKTDSCHLTVKEPLNDDKETEALPPDSLIPDSSNTDSRFIDSPAEPEPQAASKKQKLNYSCWPEIPNDNILEDWKAMRKRRKADVSQTVINRFAKQLHMAAKNGMTVDECLAICVEKGWTGFEYEWISNKAPINGHQKQFVQPSAIRPPAPSLRATVEQQEARRD